MIWTGYLNWAKLDPRFYGALPLVDRWNIIRHTFGTGIAVHYARPVRKRIRQRLPVSMLFSKLECVGRHSAGLAWYRAPDRRSAQYLADVQPDEGRAGHAILRQGDQLLLDARGHIQGWVVEGESESFVVEHDGSKWQEIVVTP